MAKDYYSTLGVSKDAKKEDIKKAFHKLAHKYHPDKEGGDEQKFKEISEAYNVLSDDTKRAEYDSYGRVFSGSGNGGGQGGFGFDASDFGGFADFDINDIFGEFFGGGGGQRNRTPRGRDISIDVELDFKESVFGTTRTVLLTKPSTCEACNGSGAAPESGTKTCPDCNGRGEIRETRRSLIGTFTSVRVCDTCHGSGTIPETPCKTCKGSGITKQQEEVSITIPAGIENGEMIRLAGRGEAVAGGVPGDLYVKIHVTPHETLKREGHNLSMTLSVKLTDALLGAEYSVETLDGTISVTIPAGVSPGEILRVKGKGVPMEGDRRGDLLIKVAIDLPKRLSKNAKKMVEQLKEEGV